MIGPAPPRAPAETGARAGSAARDRRWVAVLVLALLAGIGMLAYPLLPVTQHTATYRWDGTGPVALPLSPYRPERMTVTVQCDGIGEGMLLTTVRAVDEGMQAARGLIEYRGGGLEMTLRGRHWSIPVTGCTQVVVDITTTGVEVSRDGTVVLAYAGDVRPAVNSLVSGPGIDGVSAVVVADTQFDSSPSLAKIVLGTVSAALLAMALALAAWANHPRRRFRFPGLRPGVDDGVVLAAIAFGVIAGGATDDDGFIAQILRTPAMSGYVGNYVRWNNAPEAPFGWFYEIYARWGSISMEPVWLRLFPAALGLIAWVVLRHGLAPRLLSRLGGWPRVALAGGFTLLWLVFANSLRPEILFALGSGLVLLGVLDALHRRSVVPLLLGAVVAGLTVGAGPTGLVAVAPFVIAASALWRWLRPTPVQGLAVATAWLAALGSIVLVMFADQTLASVLSANRARAEFGPIYPFWEDFRRYWRLWWSFSARQFSVYLSVVALAALAWQWWRTRPPSGKRRLPGLNRRVAGQVIGGAVALWVVLLLGPTKLPHHFGALLLLGPLAMAAATHLLRVAGKSNTAMPHPRAAVAAPVPGLILGGSLAVVGLALHHTNSWWELSTLGLALDQNVLAVGLVPLWPFIVIAGIALGWWLTRRVRQGRFGARWAVAYAVALALLSGSQYANVAQAALVRGPERYTLASAALAAITREGCKLERSLHYEPEPAAGVLPAPALLGPDAADPFSTEVTSGLRGWVADPVAPSSLTTGWHALPTDVRSGRWPLVIAASGIDAEHRVIVEYDDGRRRTLSPTRKTLATSDLSDIRLHPEPAVSHFRMIVESDGPVRPGQSDGPMGPGADAPADAGEPTAFVVAQPRVPVTRPLLDLTARETVAVAWNLAFFAPCLDTPRQAHGRVEIADYILSDSRQPGNMSYHSRSGGPFAGVLGLTVPSRVPVYAPYDYTEAEMSELDLVRLIPAFGDDLVAVDRGTRIRGGLDAVPAIP